jgi:peptidyl-prolyl cis-trans isomerase A (cyclophilin A)
MNTIWPQILLVLALGSNWGAAQASNPRVTIQTDRGIIVVEIYERQAPLTAANFLRYVDEGLFDGATFYRVVRPDNQPGNTVKIEVVQGGLEFSSARRTFPPVEHETTAKTGILHRDGVVSMARDAPGTASSEFFICIGDQPELDFGGRRNPDGQGFAAFGRVVEGMDIVRKIQQQPADGQRLIKRIVIRSISRAK